MSLKITCLKAGGVAGFFDVGVKKGRVPGYAWLLLPVTVPRQS